MTRLYPLAYLLCLVLALSSMTMSAGNTESVHYRFTYLNSYDHGLSNNSVKCMIQDGRGVVWVGTYKGLNRYDGNKFKVYDRHDLGVESDFINCLVEDSNGNILIGTDDGIVIYDYRMDTFRKPACAEILNDRVYTMCTDPEGRVWIGARTYGVFFYDPSENNLHRAEITDSSGNRIKDVYRMAISHEGRLYMAVYCDNLYSMDIRDLKPEVLLSGERHHFFEKDDIEGLVLKETFEDCLYVASKGHGLCEIGLADGGVRVLHTLSDAARPTGLSGDGRYIWLMTTAGLIRYDLKGGTIVSLNYDKDDPFSLSEDYVTSVLNVGKEGLWVGTAHSGINYYEAWQDLFTKHYKTADGLSLRGCRVCDVVQDEAGIVFIATERMGILLYDPASGQVSRYSGSDVLPDHVNALCNDGKYLWIGYNNGICRLDKRKNDVKYYPRFIELDEDLDNRVLDMLISSEGTLYVCTSIGAMRYDEASDSFVKIACLGDRAIERMVEDDSGIIWVASYSSGIFAYNCRKDEVVGHWCAKGGKGKIPEMVSSVAIDEEGCVWGIGFSSGFYRYDHKARDFDVYDCSRLPELPTDIFFSAESDGNGNLWLASDKGLVRFDKRHNTVKVFDTLSGLLDPELGKACLRLADGTLLFGSADGFVVFEPSGLAVTGQLSGDVIIHDLYVGDETVAPKRGGIISENINIAEKITLDAGSNSFGFAFSLPVTDFLKFNNIYCRLEGYDTSYRNVSTNMDAYYYNVPAGKYRLVISTMDVTGKYIPVHDPIDVEVLPTFWQSGFGITTMLLLGLAIAAVIFAFFYYRQEQRHKAQKEKMEKEKEIELLQEKMTFFSNIVHEIKTPLTLIRTPLQNIMTSDVPSQMKDDLSIIFNSTDYLDKLVKELLDFIRVEKHGYVLEYRRFDMVDRISYACFNFSELAKNRNLKINFTHVPETMPLFADEKAIGKIINNLLHNAVKYADSYIDISLSMENDVAIVVFSNDGEPISMSVRKEIFKPFVKLGKDNSPYSQSFGIGLAFARTLAELHGGTLELDDTEETRFVLTIPVVEEISREPDIAGTEENDDAGFDRNRPLVLLVEDNYDLQMYLKRKLSVDYNMLSVSSGEEALPLLKRYKVDLLLTDIGLQGMSGVELCGRISSDFETSHIPVIVLSAITSVETKIKCMENGVAIYIEKPFTIDYLMACVKSIINKRRQLKMSWKDSSVINFEEFNLVDRDEDFLKRLENTVASHISDPEFGVAELEKSLFMSRSSLTRKMHLLLNTTPVDYIRSKRLSLAETLLRNGKYRKNEICYAVGFKSPSYFSKCFRQMYGKNPAEYLRELGVIGDNETEETLETN